MKTLIARKHSSGLLSQLKWRGSLKAGEMGSVGSGCSGVEMQLFCAQTSEGLAWTIGQISGPPPAIEPD